MTYVSIARKQWVALYLQITPHMIRGMREAALGGDPSCKCTCSECAQMMQCTHLLASPHAPYPKSTTSGGMPPARRISPMAAASDERLCSAPATRPCTSPQHAHCARSELCDETSACRAGAPARLHGCCPAAPPAPAQRLLRMRPPGPPPATARNLNPPRNISGTSLLHGTVPWVNHVTVGLTVACIRNRNGMRFKFYTAKVRDRLWL